MAAIATQRETLQGTALLTGLDADMEALVERVRRALVRIHNGGGGAGAGSVWHSVTGERDASLILTNAHVVGRHQPYVDLPDGRTLRGRVLAVDTEADLAALAVDVGDLPTIEVGDSQNLSPGAWVLAIGHPWGVPGAATAGVVIGSGKGLAGMPWAHRDWIAVSLRVRPGHSGGPLVDTEGRVVGLNTMMVGPGVGLAVPAHVARQFLREALRRQP